MILYNYTLFQAYLVYKYRGKNNEVQHTTMMSKGGGSRHMYGNNKPAMNTDTITSNANSTYDRYAEKSNTEESESLLEKDIQVFCSFYHITDTRFNLVASFVLQLVQTFYLFIF